MPDEGKTTRIIYLPKGEWFDVQKGINIRGGEEIKIKYSFSEIGLIASSQINNRPGLMNLEREFKKACESFILFRIYPKTIIVSHIQLIVI